MDAKSSLEISEAYRSIKFIEPTGSLSEAAARNLVVDCLAGDLIKIVIEFWAGAMPLGYAEQVDAAVRRGLALAAQYLMFTPEHPRFSATWNPGQPFNRPGAIPGYWLPPTVSLTQQASSGLGATQLKAYRFTASLLALEVRCALGSMPVQYTASGNVPAVDYEMQNQIMATLLLNPLLAWTISGTTMGFSRLKDAGLDGFIPAAAG